MGIPKIIHQIWSSKNRPLPIAFQKFSQTWKNLHPDWQYIFWDDQKLDLFMETYFPKHIMSFNRFPYDVQRWDAIRYLILFQMGGLYVDFDTECLGNIEPVLKRDCCFGTDTKDNIIYSSLVEDVYLNNTYIASIPEHPFMKSVIEYMFNSDGIYITASNKLLQVLLTSGSLMLSKVYSQYDCKEDICVIPAEYVSPFSLKEAHSILSGEERYEWNERIKGALAIHYFVGSWGYYE